MELSSALLKLRDLQSVAICENALYTLQLSACNFILESIPLLADEALVVGGVVVVVKVEVLVEEVVTVVVVVVVVVVVATVVATVAVVVVMWLYFSQNW
ncbi:hypothetical protein ElyMa_000267900 [Elysia marginata]|uniref:Uncharacterized protein n=1 Tax=Elysia marginata TaxID=1093978 RepID=A0AAV4F496_9GAST|nr:hypothetical protein ElyMa_000267900 [Elysia marginata]